MKNENENENKAVQTEQTEITSAVTFKKVMRGYDPAEVQAYIEEMNRTMQDATKNYENRMAEMKSALALANRERDTILARYGAETEEGPTEAEQSQLDEAQAEVAGLQGKLKEAQAARSRIEAELQSKIADERAARPVQRRGDAL